MYLDSRTPMMASVLATDGYMPDFLLMSFILLCRTMTA